MTKPNVKNSKTKKSGIQITGDSKFPPLPIDRIEIAERPKVGEEAMKLFFNPRDLESFSPESMGELRLSIRTDGLQTPPLVRAFTEDGDGNKDKVVRIELIAGERRHRSIQYIREHDLPCFDEDAKQLSKYKTGQIVICKGHFGKVVGSKNEKVTLQLLDCDNKLTDEKREFDLCDVYPTVSGKDFYVNIPCRVAFDISDARALRLAFTENGKHEPLPTKDEIALVERLTRMNLKVSEIAEMLGSNETWVSQTANFRTQLPEAALERLLDGRMKRHVAVDIMRYKPEVREKLFAATIDIEVEDSARRIQEADEEAIQAEDAELLLLSDKKKLVNAGDVKGANKAGRKAAGAASKAEKARSKKDRAIEESGQIKTSHIQKGAAKAGLSPKKAKILPKEEIEELFISEMEEHLSGESVDPVCGEDIPADYVSIVIRTAKAIIKGDRDALGIIRSYMIAEERWESAKKKARDEDDEEDDEDDDDDDGPSAKDLADLGYELDDGPADEDFEAVGVRRGRRSRDDDDDF